MVGQDKGISIVDCVEYLQYLTKHNTAADC